MIMRPNNKRLERDRGSIRSDFAPGNPRPVHPRPTDACAAARGFEICVRAQLQSPARPPVVLLHDVKQPAPPPGAAQHLSFPRRIFCVRVRISFAPDPDEGRAERRQAHGCSGTRRACHRCVHARLTTPAFAAAAGQALAKRLASLNGGTRASRRSAVAIFGRGPRFHLRHCLRIRAASSSQPGRHAWRAVSRTSRVRGYEPQPQDATPRSAFRIVSRRRPS
jgi:hypothetical protein